MTSPAYDLLIEPCSSLAELGEVRAHLKKKQERGFLVDIFEKRDKQLFPRDLLVAFVPTRRSGRAKVDGDGDCRGGRRAVGILRRTLKFDKVQRCSSLYIDFVWVMKEARGLHIGRKLLNAGIQLGPFSPHTTPPWLCMLSKVPSSLGLPRLCTTLL